MQKQSLITIVTVCRNTEKGIRDTMLSVLGQTYPAIEYIVVDGASTDRTLDIVRSMEEDFRAKGYTLRYMSEPDKGIYDAMNKGIRLATGEWINFMNVDDSFVSPDTVAQVFAEPVDGDVTVVYGNTRFLYDFGTMQKLPRPFERLKEGMIFCHQSSFVRTAVMKAHPFDTLYKTFGDYNFFYNNVLIGGGKFLYRNIDIANFEHVRKSTARQKTRAYWERAHIKGIDTRLSWKVGFVFKCFSTYLKYFLQRALPSGLVKAVRERNYRRQGASKVERR